MGLGEGEGQSKKFLVKTSQNDTGKICMQYEDDLMRFSGTTDRRTDVKGDSNTPSGETPRGKNSVVFKTLEPYIRKLVGTCYNLIVVTKGG